MAATLLRLKSKLLLRPFEAGKRMKDLFQFKSPEERYERLEEYRRFKGRRIFREGGGTEQGLCAPLGGGGVHPPFRAAAAETYYFLEAHLLGGS